MFYGNVKKIFLIKKVYFKKIYDYFIVNMYNFYNCSIKSYSLFYKFVKELSL